MTTISHQLGEPPLSREERRAFRDALGTYATGVAVASTLDESGNPIGLTINSFASVSLEPPLVLWSIDIDAACTPAFLACQYWCVSVLCADQEAIALGFAAPTPHPSARFEMVETRKGIGGVPLINGAVTTFECEQEATHAGGDHHILVGRVVRFTSRPDQPLVFHQGRFKRF